MKVRALMDYTDLKLNKNIKKGEEYNVSKSRAEVLLKGNDTSKNMPIVEIVVEEQVCNQEQ